MIVRWGLLDPHLGAVSLRAARQDHSGHTQAYPALFVAIHDPVPGGFPLRYRCLINVQLTGIEDLPRPIPLVSLRQPIHRSYHACGHAYPHRYFFAYHIAHLSQILFGRANKYMFATLLSADSAPM